jgi:hypothetical protein
MPKVIVQDGQSERVPVLEFQAIERPLSKKEMAELRSYSTRARITPTSFVSDYSWGNFKGDADVRMAKYFDVFRYAIYRDTLQRALRG